MQFARILTTLVAIVGFTTAAQSQERTLKGISGSRLVFVWKDADAHGEAMSLIQAGVHETNPSLLEDLLACVVPVGTQAIITDLGFVTHDVLVTSGDFAGCRGNVAAEVFRGD